MSSNPTTDADESPADQEPDASARALALDAVIRTAIDKAATTSIYSRRIRFEDMAANLQADVGDRTLRRAIGDADELDWLADRSRGTKSYRPGPRAEDYQPTPDDVEGDDG